MGVTGEWGLRPPGDGAAPESRGGVSGGAAPERARGPIEGAQSIGVGAVDLGIAGYESAAPRRVSLGESLGVRAPWHPNLLVGALPMRPSAESVANIAQWMGDNFPDTSIGSHNLETGPHQDVVLFRALGQQARAPSYELLVSYKALEDHSVETITRDLNGWRVAAALRAQPDRLLMYNRFRRVVVVG